MSEKNLFTALSDCASITQEMINLTEQDFLKPSYLVAMAAYITKNRIPPENFPITDKHETYLNTIGFLKLLQRDYAIHKPNVGKNYSELTLLEDETDIDKATTQISSCISHLTQDKDSKGITALKEVIGELHDNVWSHGASTGFSMVQKYSDNTIEFALADCGLGFLNEVKKLERVGINITSDKEAMKWCVTKGNSSKKIIADTYDDGWEQQLPSDIMGNPMGNHAKVKKSNNHMGLGLDKLIQLIRMYKGTLDIISGYAHLSLNGRNDKMNFHELKLPWHGVLIAFKLSVDELNHSNNTVANENDISEVLNFLIN